MTTKTPSQSFQDCLFSDPEQSVYAVLDGASFSNLPAELTHHKAEYVCLYRGELEADIAIVAPYLVSLPPGANITPWVLKQIGRNNPGIFIHTRVPVYELRKHLRTFLMIKDVNDQQVYFRYYDPRVLRSYIPSCNAEEKKTLFGPISHYFVENKEGNQLVRYGLNDSLSRIK